MELSVMGRLDPENLLRKFISQNVRPDGRSFMTSRRFSVVKATVSKHAAGSALVKIGKTKVLAAVTLQVGQPGEETPTYGEVGVEVHLPPLCAPRFTSIQSQQDQGQSLSKFIQTILLRSEVIPRQDLCIKEGKHVWKLCVDIMCLNYEGNVVDAALMAAVAALDDVTLPEVLLSPDEDMVVIPAQQPPDCPRKLSLTRYPIPLTCGIFDGEILCDLSLEEEQVITDHLTLVMDHTGQVGKERA